MDTILEKSLIDCLSWCGVSSLPPEDTNENVWIKAIAKVVKADATENYVAVVRGENGENRIVKDFGRVFPIIKVEAYYPYLYLDASFVPTFKDDRKKDERIKWLSVFDHDKDWGKLTIKELNKAIINQAAQNQLKMLKK